MKVMVDLGGRPIPHGTVGLCWTVKKSDRNKIDAFETSEVRAMTIPFDSMTF